MSDNVLSGSVPTITGGGLGRSQPLRSVQSPSLHEKGLPTYHHRTLFEENAGKKIAITGEVSADGLNSTTAAPVAAPLPSAMTRQQQQQVFPAVALSSGSVPIPVGQEMSLDNEADLFLSRGPLLRPAPLLDDERGIVRVRTLVSRRAWADVVRMTAELLQTATSPYASFHSDLINMDVHKSHSDNPTILRLEHETAEIIALRFTAMLKLRRYSDLGREVDRLNLLEETTLPWVPFGLQILAAHTLQYTNKPDRCIDTLHRMKYRLTAINLPWLSTLNNTLANAFLRQKEWRLALAALSDLMSSTPNAAQTVLRDRMQQFFHLQLHHDEVETVYPPALNADQLQFLSSVLTSSSRIEILSRQGRILLQVGAILEAEFLFQSIENNELPKLYSSLEYASKILEGGSHQDFLTKLKHTFFIQQAPIQILLNEGLLLFAKEDYFLSMDAFRQAIEKQRSNTTTNTTHVTDTSHTTTSSNFFQEDFLSPGLGFDIEPTLITFCLNNMALCALYTCQMNKAVDYMEHLICENPTLYLTEGLAFNICTLYELGSENTVSTRKKNVLQQIAKRFFLHDITSEYFRIV